MNAKFGNITFLEAAKAGIETFIKSYKTANRAKANRDLFQLTTYTESSGLKDDPILLLDLLKFTTASALSDPPFLPIFDRFSLYRFANDFETIAKGVYPASSESVLIFWFTDSDKITTKSSVLDQLSVPPLSSVGSDLYLEPFRWDQRLYTFGMNIERPKLAYWNDNMGGAFWIVHSPKHLIRTIENCVGPNIKSNVIPSSPVCWTSGVKCLVKGATPADNIDTHSLFVYAHRNIATHFPIPESYWPDSFASKDISKVPKRRAHPTILISTKPEMHSRFLIKDFPVDKYHIDQSPSFISKLKSQKSGTCWTVLVPNTALCSKFAFCSGYWPSFWIFKGRHCKGR
jgi:hypothetical protein